MKSINTPFLKFILFTFLLNVHNAFSTEKDLTQDFRDYEKNSFYQIAVIINIYKDSAQVVVPKNFELSLRSDIVVNIYYDYKVQETNLNSFRLAITSGTTSLVPVKIPPPSNFSGKKKVINIDPIYLDYKIIPGPDSPGHYTLGFYLEECVNETCSSLDLLSGDYIDHEQVNYRVYDFIDLIPKYDGYTREKNNISFDFRVCDQARFYKNEDYRLTNTLNVYLSSDDHLDGNDSLLTSLYVRNFYQPPYYEPCGKTMYTVDNETFQHWIDQNKYLVVEADAKGRRYETNEDNNIVSIRLKPNLQITDIRVYKTPDNLVALSSTITNNGNVTSDRSKLDFYVENYPRKFVARGTIPSLEPGESYTVSSLVTWQYFSVRLYLKNLILVLDPDNEIEETDENDNEKRFKVPRLNGEQTFVKVSPNPIGSHDYEVNFNFSVNRNNADVKLSLYDHRGILKYQTNTFFPEKGDQQISVPSHRLPGSGAYHYSFLIGWDGHYFPFTGTIIKQ